MEGNPSKDDKVTCQKIFQTIDTDGTGSCSIEELTVNSNQNLKHVAGVFDTTYPQVFLKKLFYNTGEIEEFINLADTDGSGEVDAGAMLPLNRLASPRLVRAARALRQVTFEEFWALKSKSRQRRRQRDITITVFKAENILNAGPHPLRAGPPCSPRPAPPRPRARPVGRRARARRASGSMMSRRSAASVRALRPGRALRLARAHLDHARSRVGTPGAVRRCT